MKSDTTHSTFAQPEAETAVYLFDDWFDPIETCVRDRVREFIQAMIEGELDATLLRPRYGRLAKHAAADKVVPSAVGHRHGRRSRSLTGTFGRVEIEVPRARLEGANGKTTEWQSKVLRADGQKVLLAVKSMGGETTEAWCAVLDDLIKRGLRRPEFLIVDGATGLEQAIAAVWEGVPVQRCTVHKHRNLLAHAPERLHDEVTADYTDMIYAATPTEIAARRKAFLRKWRLKCKPVADSLEEAGDRLFTFTRLAPSQWRSARTTNAIECLHEEFKRRIKTQTVLPSADTAAMLFWA